MAFDQISDAAEAATLTVGLGQTYASIQSAINAATVGDTISVFAGIFNEKIAVSKALTLIGNDSAVTTVNGGLLVTWLP